uniref:Methyltransferase type 11 domain-containing protein n=1 Tax=Arcella intermedia TaxID=1963864 RepID=A0A6B2LCY1_9EUKA
MQDVQVQLAERALELLALPPNTSKLIMDIGCGTGISGLVLQKAGHTWLGLDISEHMLITGKKSGEQEGDLMRHDMGTGLGFRSGIFDGVISISALQWLCNADSSAANPVTRINRFFNSLYACMVRGGRAVFQFYPENSQQIELLTSAALRSGFTGGLLVDYPNSTKAKKYFLVLFAGTLPGQHMPKALGAEQSSDTVSFVGQRDRMRKSKGKKSDRAPVKSKEWILNKKERQRKQGKETRPDSAYTGRKRRPKF